MNLYDLSSSSSASSGVINIAVSAKKIDVDNRIALRYYYRIAENMLKQASIYREEKNLIDLYILLLRFSSLISETIPCHKDYQSFSPKEKKLYKKRLLDTVAELEVLKPIVLPQIEESNKRRSIQANQWTNLWDKNSFEDNSDNSIEWPPVRRQAPRNYDSGQVNLGVVQAGSLLGAQQHKQVGWDRPSPANFIEDHLSKLSLSVPRPSEETLSRHSILGHSGLHNQRQAPIYDKRVQYPGNLDLTPVQLPSLTYKAQDPLGKGGNNFVSGTSIIESVLSLDDGRRTSQPENNSWSVAPMSMVRPPVQFDIIRQPSLPPVLADVHDMVPASSPLTGAQPLPTKSLQDDHAPSGPLQLHVPPRMMDEFMRLAKSNTQKNLETCGVLAGSLKNRKFYVTTILIPKQESTSDSCQTLNEEEIFEAQDSRSLFPLGWIHTHPTQSCFMSSIDLHTHYSYQIMLPEAIAIVMAPTDTIRTHGIFRLSDPGGIKVIRNCQERGFHPHDEPPDGSPIYELCTNVYMNPNIKFEVIDLR